MSDARETVARLLWTRSGARRVPRTAALDSALARLRRGDLFRICELDPRGPLYLLPTREFVAALAARIRATFEVDVTLREFLEEPTVAGVARVVDEAVLGAAPADLDAMIERLEQMDDGEAEKFLESTP